MEAVQRLSFTVSEAVKATGIGRNRLLQLIHANDIKAIRLGKRKFIIPRSEIETYLQTELEKAA